jgi:hypothetical protein
VYREAERGNDDLCMIWWGILTALLANVSPFS